MLGLQLSRKQPTGSVPVSAGLVIDYKPGITGNEEGKHHRPLLSEDRSPNGTSDSFSPLAGDQSRCAGDLYSVRHGSDGARDIAGGSSNG